MGLGLTFITSPWLGRILLSQVPGWGECVTTPGVTTLNTYYRTGTLNAIMIAITDYCYLQPGKPLLRVLCKLSLADACKLELILSYLFVNH